MPTDNISKSTMYFVPSSSAGTNNVYDEYVYVNKGTESSPQYAWELVGSTEIDLTNYITNTDYASNNTGGVVKTNTNYGTSVDSNGSLRGTTKTYADYDSMHSLGLISKVTLENVIEGKGLVTNTDYATSAVGGVIRTGTSYGTTMASGGILRSTSKTYADYSSAGDYMFIGKGTLENVIEGKGLVSNTDYGSDNTAGVIKSSSTYGTQFASTGAMYARTKTYAQYISSASPGLFVGKGTLENVFNGRGLLPIVTLTQQEYDALATKDPDTYYYIEES